MYKIDNETLLNLWQVYVIDHPNSEKSALFYTASLHCNPIINNTLCQYPNCGICSFNRDGLQDTDILVFPHSSTCHDFSEGKPDIGYRAQIICFIVADASSHLTVWRSSCNTYEGIVVSKNCPSLLPIYVFIYRRDGTERLTNF